MSRRLPKPVRHSTGVWRVDVSLGYGPDGKRQRKTLYGPTPDAVQDALIAYLAARQKGQPQPGGRLTVGQYLARWIDETKRQELRPTSWARYRYDIEHHLLPAIGPIPLTKLTPADVRGLLARLRGKRGQALSLRSRRSVRDTLRAALHDALVDELVIRNVASLVRLPDAPRRQATVLELADVRRLLAAVERTRFEGFVAVAFAFGLRLGECLGLRWSDIDGKRRTITIRHQLQNLPGARVLVEPKTQGTARTRRLPEATLAALDRHRETVQQQRLLAPVWQEHDLVLPSATGAPWPHQSFRNAWHRFLRAARLPRLNPHDLRHSCVTLLLAHGAPPGDVQRHVGHETERMTMGLYNHLLGSQEEAMSRLLDQLLLGEMGETPGE